jgi:dihydropyrimidinase
MRFDLILRDARIVTPTGEVRGAIGVRGGTIAAIGALEGAEAAETIEAAGRIVLPGGVDSHCHIAQRPVAGEPPCPDDFATATRAAAMGGTTTVIPHSMCARGEDPLRVLDDYLASAEGRAVVDYHAHVQMAEADPAFLAGGLEELAARGFGSVKIFTTYPGYGLADDEILRVFEAAARAGILCIVHAEDDAIVRHATAREIAAGRTGLDSHPHARPIEAEAGMIRRLAGYAGLTGAEVHVFHVTAAAALEEIALARARGVRITGETCAHYLSFTAQDYARPGFEGARFLCAPPIRGPADREALWSALASGGLDIVSSDHSPSHRMAQIARARSGERMAFTAFSGGIPGLQTLLPAVFSAGVSGGRIDLARFAFVTAEAPARRFGLFPRKGAITVGADADLVLWDPDRRWRMEQHLMESRVDFTPWEGVEMTGAPVLAMVRGRVVMRAGKITPGIEGHGRLAPRGASC